AYGGGAAPRRAGVNPVPLPFPPPSAMLNVRNVNPRLAGFRPRVGGGTPACSGMMQVSGRMEPGRGPLPPPLDGKEAEHHDRGSTYRPEAQGAGPVPGGPGGAAGGIPAVHLQMGVGHGTAR